MKKFNGHLPVAMIVVLCAAFLPAQSPAPANPAATHVVFSIPGMHLVNVRKNISYAKRGDTVLAFDHYSPKDIKPNDKLPAVVFISGGEETKDWAWFTDYGRLAGVSGLIGITYNKRYSRGLDGLKAGFADTQDLIRYLRDNAKKFNIDENRICLWAFSAGGRLSAAGLQDEHSYIRCLVIFYGVVDLAAELDNLPPETRAPTLLQYGPIERLVVLGKSAPPIFLARAGHDSSFINSGLEHFVSAAQKQNIELLFLNYPEGDHGFDGYNNTEMSRWIVKQALAFIKEKTR
jgi:acetyl esterase/lipase